MRFEIITIGAELLDGTLVDTNTSEIALGLKRIGAEVVRATVVPDEQDSIRSALTEATARSDAVIATGGLGPTSDDRTKQVAARVFDRNLELDEEVLGRIRARFESTGRPMPEINISQAMVPEGARAIPNSRGTAPGIVLEDDERLLFLLPGVPFEMRAMFEGYVLPFLEGRGLRRQGEERILRTTGIPESALAELIGPTARRLARTEVAYLPSLQGVDVRILTRADGPRGAAATADRSVDRLEQLIGRYVYSRGSESLDEVVGFLLSMERKTLAVAESCTGGLVGYRLTSVPGSSDYMKGGVIAYSDDLKKRLLKVRAGTLREHGAVSRETALEMALGARDRCKADYGLSVTGIAGPGGGSEEKPVGLVWMAVSARGVSRARSLRFAGDRAAVRARAAQAALDLTRRVLLGIREDD